MKRSNSIAEVKGLLEVRDALGGSFQDNLAVGELEVLVSWQVSTVISRSVSVRGLGIVSLCIESLN